MLNEELEFRLIVCLALAVIVAIFMLAVHVQDQLEIRREKKMRRAEKMTVLCIKGNVVSELSSAEEIKDAIVSIENDQAKGMEMLEILKGFESAKKTKSVEDLLTDSVADVVNIFANFGSQLVIGDFKDREKTLTEIKTRLEKFNNILSDYLKG